MSEEEAKAMVISIRAPAWGATMAEALETRIYTAFQSALPRGERLSPIMHSYLAYCNFNPRSRVGSDNQCHIVPHYFSNFNPRSRVGSDADLQQVVALLGDFNPRSRVGSDKIVNGLIEKHRISIRAPAWGATSSSISQSVRSSISIRAPAWGATQSCISCIWLYRYFNPRSRVGSDSKITYCTILNFYFNPRSRVGSDGTKTEEILNIGISIRAPAWGATSISQSVLSSLI